MYFLEGDSIPGTSPWRDTAAYGTLKLALEAAIIKTNLEAAAVRIVDENRAVIMSWPEVQRSLGLPRAN